MQATHPVAAERAPTTTPATSKFRLIAELGRGGMATVYLGVVSGIGGFNKLQVVKRLRAGLAADPEFLNMFLEEARLAARINHPNVVQTYEIGFDGEHHFISMEYLEGQTLESIVRLLARRRSENGGEAADAGEDLPLPMRLRILSEALAGLHFAHDLADFDGTPLNVVHRDVSPHNIIVTYDGHVKVVDFGIAKAADSSNDTRTGILKGKCAYMAPEQFGGQGVDRRADVFVCGILLWQLLTGTKLWKGLSDTEIFQRLATGQIPTPRSVVPSLPEALDAICMRALALQPADRYQTAADFQSALEDYLATGTRVSTREVGAWVSKQFAERRAKIKAVIEEQMRAAKDGPVPVLRAPQTSNDVPSAATATQVPDTATAIAGPRPARLLRLVSLAVIGIGAAATVLVMAMRPRPHDTAETAPTAKTATPFGNPTTPLTTLTVTADPRAAVIYVDDVPLASNPSTTTMVRDGAAHRLRAEAPGFASKRDLVTFDSEVATVTLTLEALNPGVAEAPKQAKPTTRRGPPPRPIPNSKTPPQATPPVTSPPEAPAAKPETPAAEPKPKPKPALIDQNEDPWKK